MNIHRNVLYINILQHAHKDYMDPIVKTGVVLTVQFQRDVTRKQEHVLVDARLDGDLRHVFQVRQYTEFFKISIDSSLYLLLILF